jgi:copper type II ascorbate-dependent monooxygenase-like protein
MRTFALAALGVVVFAAGMLGRTTHAGPNLRPITFLASSGRVRPGDEEQLCHRRVMPRAQETEVNRVLIKVKGGSHHIHLYRPYNGPAVYPTKSCPFAVDFMHWELVAAAQTSALDWQLPAGVAIDFSPHQPLMIQTHFVNAQQLTVAGSARAKMKLYPIDPSTVRAHGGALFAQDRTVKVPPGSSTEISRCALTGAASEGRRLTIMALTGHYHFRGVEFSAYRVHADGTLGELVYENTGYVDPKFQMYDDGALVLEPGEGLEWWCRYQNDTTETFDFGANTQRNEHCNMFGFYYPTNTPQEAIDCVHRIDDQGIEHNDRIVAEE